MLEEFHKQMHIISKVYKYTIEAKEEMYYRFLLPKWSILNEVFYLDKMTENLKHFDSGIFTFRFKTFERELLNNDSFYLIYPYSKHRSVRLYYRMDKKLITFNGDILNSIHSSTENVLSLKGSEKEKMENIKDAFLEEILNNKEFRLPYLTGMIKVKV